MAVGVAALRALKQHRLSTAGILLPITALMLWWYAVTDKVMGELPPVTPHIVTLLVLVLATSRLRMPAANGLRYRRGQE